MRNKHPVKKFVCVMCPNSSHNGSHFKHHKSRYHTEKAMESTDMRAAEREAVSEEVVLDEKQNYL